ncbi:MAG: pre-peptidase C-terminal domain-containing protein, partial [Pirellulaceae bacterium]|nr:pre-peptidase C-terminal domain-containing protein [Pirellulaceae bacterium]
TNLAQLGGLVGGFGNAADPTQLAALGQLLGGFGGSLTGPQLGSLLGGFGAAASPAALGPVLGGFGSAVTASQLGALVGGFGTSVTAEQLGRLLGGFGTGLSATQLGSLLGGFGGAVRSADLGAVLGGFGSVALHPDDLGSLLGAFSAVLGTPVPALEDVAQAFGSAQLTSTQLGSVLGSYQDALGTGALVVLSTLLSGFGTGSGNLAELGAVLGGFGNAVPAAAQPELGAVLAGFGGSLTASQLGTLLGGFGAASATDALGAVLGGFGGAVSASQLGTLLGSFGGAVAAQDLGRLLGGFGAGLTSAQLGTLIGGFGGAVTPPALGAVLGGFSAAALTTTDIDALLAAFRTATGTPLASLTEVAEAFGGAASNSVQLGSVLGGFGLGTGSALNTGTLVVLGTLLGGFGAGTTNLAQLGGLVGGFGNAADPTQLAALGQLLGGFGGFADSLQLDDVGHLLGGFVAVQGRAELDAVLAASSADLSAEVFGTLSAVIRSYADGLINRAQLDVQLAELAAQFSPEELETVLDTLTGDLSPMQLGQALAGFATTLQPEKLGNLLAGFVDSDKAAGLAALLAALRATISTGPGDDVVSGVVLTTFRTHAGDDILFAGTTDASFLINALVDAGFSLPTAYASLAVSGAVLNGGAGDDTYYLIGELLGHLKLVEAAEVGTDTSRDTIDLSGFGGGAARVDLAQASEQTVHQGALWLTLSSGTGWEDVVGTRWADTIAGNDRDNQLFGSDPLESRAMLPPRRAVSTQYVYLDFDSETNSGEYLYSPSERETIRARLNEYYRGPDPAHPWFDFQFVLTPPASSTYVTVLFNRTPDNEAAGGLSEEIDFRNLNRDTRVYVDVNGLLGGPGQPAATGENFAALSITIAAHEVGHSAGARHFYASGPIGFGIHVPPGPDAYKPSYPGLVAALETTLHVMASPASVGSSLSQAVESLFFSERTAIVLAFAEQGVVVQEDAAATQSPGGQALGELPGLLVPNTIRRGLNAHRDLAVAAIDVVGSIDIDPATGKSESDWYSFAGRVGDVINIEMMSASQTRFAGNAIDAILRLYGADGTLIPSGAGTLAFNDDQFESSDAQIIDFVLPADGVYYVEVDTFHIRLPEFLGTAGGPGYLPPGFSVDGFVAENPDSEIVKDTDTGAYELFLFRFDAGNAMDGGDAIDGRSGNDVLAGFAGNDVLIGGAGSDKFLFDDRSLQDLDTVEGGTGRDRLDFSMRTAGINISLADTGSAQNLGGTQFLRLPHEDLEDIIGTLADDQLIGNSLDNFLVGDPGLDPLRGGNDKIVGASGDDVLIGHAGDDDITGSSGDDVLIGGYGVDRLAASAGADILFAGELQGTAEGDLRPANYNGADWDWWNNYELLRALSLWWSAGFDPDATTDDESLWGPDDAARDVLTGGTGPDWFVVGADDVITDLAGNGDRDRVTRL